MSASAVATLLRQQLESAFNQAGHTTMSEDRACRLLAFAYVLGGAYEPAVFHERLRHDLLLAGKRLSLEAGETPLACALPALQTYVYETEIDGWHTPWLAALLAEYDLQLPVKAPKTAL